MLPIISKSTIDQKFACDLLKCKGACCTLTGGVGAPLMESEINFVKEFEYLTLQFLPEINRKIILEEGSIEIKNNTNVLKCVENKDCVFVFYEDNIAKCSFEKLFNENNISWKKPMSCRLFPLRERNGKLIFEPIDECASGVKNGVKLNTKIDNFLKKDLIEAYGKEWYFQNVARKES
ncbi:MAG: DUF3109 family protein [Bacteroidetes bacterium]|nr:DUF3109 family protein [Bacteroidota bacterium]